MALRLRAPAKVNLGLRVLSRRPDGYHELDTIFHALDLSDDLVAELGEPGIELEVTGGAGDAGGPGGPLDGGPDNLVHRAARAFISAAGVDRGARLRLVKRIPLGAGLGGGSSDAAAALRLLNALHGSPLAPGRLHELAAGLGADVPFFLLGGTQRGGGRGEILTPMPHPSRHFLLLLPPFGTSTASVYKNHPPQLIIGPEKASISADKTVPSKGLAVPDQRRNDLEGAAMELYPELARLRARIVRAGYPEVAMSGSGSTLFLTSESEAGIQEAVGRLGFLAGHGVQLLRTRSAAGSAAEPSEVAWPGPHNQGG